MEYFSAAHPAAQCNVKIESLEVTYPISGHRRQTLSSSMTLLSKATLSVTENDKRSSRVSVHHVKSAVLPN